MSTLTNVRTAGAREKFDAEDVENVTATGTQTLTNKTLTTPVISTLYKDAAKTKLMTVPDVASDTLVAVAAAQTLTNKTLTTPIVAAIYQDAGKTKLLTIPDTASDTLVALAATQTMTNKTLTAPVVTSPDLTLGSASHDYAGAAVAWTLSAAELKASRIVVTNANGAVDAIAVPTAGKMYIVLNTSGQELTFKASGQSGIAIASTKAAIVMGNGTDFYRITADA